jgi:hypothetical protein
VHCELSEVESRGARAGAQATVDARVGDKLQPGTLAHPGDRRRAVDGDAERLDLADVGVRREDVADGGGVRHISRLLHRKAEAKVAKEQSAPTIIRDDAAASTCGSDSSPRR